MIHSMTGFASVSQECAAMRLNVELRAVNHRYLDVQFKIPDELRALEGAMREQISAAVGRGKLECRIQCHSGADTQPSALALDAALVAQLAQLNQGLTQQYPQLAPLSVAEVLRFPGVLISQEQDRAAVEAGVLALLGQVLADFNHSRLREGEKLAQHLLERLTQMAAIVAELSERFPDLLAAHLDKVRQRLREAVDNIEEDRLKQEFALFMQKADVDEELSRLNTHIAAVRRIIQGNGSVGKRLDFLMQELNREANTLGSKAIAAECTQASVALKVLIEQMREQVQNIE